MEQKLTEAEIRKIEEQESGRISSFLGITSKAGQRIIHEGRSAFDPYFNARDEGTGQKVRG